MATATELVDKGEARLNKFFAGRSWVTRIDTTVLDLAHDDECLLGQLFGSFEVGCDVLKCYDDSQSYGFLSNTLAGITNEALTDEWRKRVRRLRQPKEGDEVVVSYLTTHKPDLYSKSQTFSPYALRNVFVTRIKADPEPGDRVHDPLSNRFGSVLKPRKGGLTTSPDCARVAWDNGYGISNVPISRLTVAS
jgi:hypothetical protein